MLSLLPAKRPLIMGIVNATPDSFSGDGLLSRADADPVSAAVDQALRMAGDGADLLDIGGESSRPGAVHVSADEEARRVVPVIEALHKHLGDSVPLSIDTVKASVAEAALAAGASIVNDISALRADPGMAPLAVRTGCFVVLMHNRSNPLEVRHDARLGSHYGAPPASGLSAPIGVEVAKELSAAATAALQAGIQKERIILDPGLGFGKTVAQNLALLKDTEKLKSLGFPVLIGPSRKSFIGQVLDAPVDDRLEGTAAAVAIAAFLNADILRVHDARFMARVAAMAAAIRSSA